MAIMSGLEAFEKAVTWTKYGKVSLVRTFWMFEVSLHETIA
jgi:hypothetical protein